jgi:hypothetical protein
LWKPSVEFFLRELKLSSEQVALLSAFAASVWRDKMNPRSVLSVSATIALGLALFGIAAGSTARAAEIKLLCAVALHPAIDVLIPEFENPRDTKSQSPTEMRALSRTVFKRVRPPIL